MSSARSSSAMPSSAIPSSASPSAPSPEPSNLATLSLEVSGMKCAGCSSAVERRLRQQPGVEAAAVNLVTTVATVQYFPEQTDAATLATSLTEIGFPAQRRDQAERARVVQDGGRSPLRQQLGSLLLSGLLIFLSSLGHVAPLLGINGPLLETLLENIWLHWGLATITLLLCRELLLNGFQGLRHGIPNMNTLVGLGALSAYGASLVALLWPQLGWECFFDEPVMLLGFILLGRTLEQQARHRASQSLRSLLSLKPDQASILVQTTDQADAVTNGNGPTPSGPQDPSGLLNRATIQIPAERLRVGEQLRILPGERIPADGQVLAGQTTVDESMLTGEFEPVLKQIGDALKAGSLNLSAPLVLEVTQAGADTTLARMIELVETAQARKAPIQRLVDRVAGYFTYGVMALAGLTFLFWYFIGTQLWPQVLTHQGAWLMGMQHGAGLHHSMAIHSGMAVHSGLHQSPTPLLLSLKLAIAVLVVACPCSLGLATPTAMLVGSGLGAERGLLIRGGDVLEQVHHLDTIVLDKTGTLTLGQPQLQEIVPLGSQPYTAAELLCWAASLEAGTRHPLGQALVQAAQGAQLELLPVQESLTQPGFGVRGEIGGKEFCLGNWAWLQAQGIGQLPRVETQGESLAAAGKTVVYLSRDGHLVGLLTLSDTLRSDAIATVNQLQARGLQVYLLTGDRPSTAQAIAQALQLNPEQVMAEVTPAAKAQTIAQLQAQGRQVAMVGDGINDAPALAQADVGIALHSGTEVAIETAQIVLMGDRLSDVLAALDLSEATLGKIRQNLAWAFAYNLMALPLAAGVLLPFSGLAFNPALAGGLMALSSVIVVTNSLLLRWSIRWSTPQPERV